MGGGGTNNVSDERSKNGSLAGSEMTILSSYKETEQPHYKNQLCDCVWSPCESMRC